MTGISALPEECVQLIFDRISIKDLQLIHRLSPGWGQPLLQQQVERNFLLRKTLIVSYGFRSKDVILWSAINKDFADHNIDENGNSLNLKAYIEHNHILLKRGLLNVNSIAETFPNVRTLIIASDRALSADLRSFNQLIAKYSSKLVTLQMYFTTLCNIKNGAQLKSANLLIGSLFDKLNSMTALQHFTFVASRVLAFENGWNKLNPVINHPIFLTRIKELNINCHSLTVIIHQCLRKYANEGGLGQLSRINLGAKFSTNELSTNQFANWPVEVAKCLSNAPYNPYAYNQYKIYLQRIIAKFPSLTRIFFFFEVLGDQRPLTAVRAPVDVTLSKLANLLSPLTKLVHLHLHLKNVNIQSEPLDPFTTPQLESIKALKLEYHFTRTDCSMFRNELVTFVHIFPNLRSIRVVNRDKSQEDTNVLTQSARDLLADLKGAYGRDSLEVTLQLRYEFDYKL